MENMQTGYFFKKLLNFTDCHSTEEVPYRCYAPSNDGIFPQILLGHCSGPNVAEHFQSLCYQINSPLEIPSYNGYIANNSPTAMATEDCIDFSIGLPDVYEIIPVPSCNNKDSK